jgi:hypothetical protein
MEIDPKLGDAFFKADFALLLWLFLERFQNESPKSMGIMHLVPSHVVIPISQKGGSCIEQRKNAAIACVLLSWRSCNAGNRNEADNVFLRLYLPLAFTSNLGQVGALNQPSADVFKN